MDRVGITDCVRLLGREVNRVVSAVIKLDCGPGRAVGSDDRCAA